MDGISFAELREAVVGYAVGVEVRIGQVNCCEVEFRRRHDGQTPYQAAPSLPRTCRHLSNSASLTATIVRPVHSVSLPL